MPDGPLLAIGGHEDRTGARIILRRVAELTRGGELALVTAGSKEPARYAELYERAFADLGVRVRHVPAAEDRARALLADAGGAFLTGGKQQRLVERLRAGTVEALRALHRRGGVIAGTSAGASALGERMIGRGGLSAAGLGFLPGVIIDQHFSQRTRWARLRIAVDTDRTMVGIGLDEDTAIEFAGATFTALGSGAVTVMDARRPSPSLDLRTTRA